jgi:hypothetical protein
MKIRYNHGGVKSKWNSKWLIIFPHLPTFPYLQTQVKGWFPYTNPENFATWVR